MNKHVVLAYRDLARTQPYVDALIAAGTTPALVSPGWSGAIEDHAGLVLMGGTDVDPGLYGESREPETNEPDRERDDFELALIGRAAEAGLPVLAICRGMQILNVFHGGTLIQHLSHSERHRPEVSDRSAPVHDVAIRPGTLLAEIAGTSKWQVNSRHHQAVKALGDNLRISAVDSEDGTVEAIERPDKPFVLGIQWHPEDQVGQDAGQLKIFRSFVARVFTNL
jgi:putative glutamine amidotransferase